MTFVSTQKQVVQFGTQSFSRPTMPPDIVELINQVGATRNKAEATAKRIKALQAQLKPYADKMKLLTELVTKYAQENGLDPDKEFSTATDNFVLHVGKAGTQRMVVDNGLMMKKMGKALFLQKCTIGLGLIDQYLTPEEKQGVLNVERCSRGIKILHRV